MAKLTVTQHNISTVYYSETDITSAIDSGFAYALHKDPDNKELLRVKERIFNHLGLTSSPK